MNYDTTLQWLFSRLPMYQREGKKAYKTDLTNTVLLDDHLGNPSKSFKSIHVAGTNGKGSVCHMLAAIFQEAGFKTGLYTSPHLKDFRERIRVNGEMIPQQEVVDFVRQHKKFFESGQLSFFEMTVGMAFEHFKNEQVDIAIVEVGLGGRLDSTNIINPEVAAITNIGLDHTEFLGETLREIAFEKGGIIKQGIPVVIGEVTAETRGVFTSIARERTALLYFAEEMVLPEYPSDLKGSYQQKNIRTVSAIVEVMRLKGWALPEAAVKTALLHVRELTGMKGRWQWLAGQPRMLCDTAHNEDGIREVMEQLSQQDYEQLHIVLGVVKDKPLSNILSYFPKQAIYYFCTPDIPRGLPVAELKETARMAGLKGRSFNSVSEACQAAKLDAGRNDLIFVGGSTFTVAEVL